MANHAALDAHIARIRKLDGLAERVAPDVAMALERELLDNVDAQVGPDGRAWQPTQSGKAALQGTAAGMTVRAIGTTVLASLDAVHSRHDLGIARGRVRRQILPTKGIPAPAVRAIDQVVTREFERTMGGR